MGLKPEESIPKKICFTVVFIINDEIIFSSVVPVILSANFCNVVKCGIFDNWINILK